MPAPKPKAADLKPTATADPSWSTDDSEIVFPPIVAWVKDFKAGPMGTWVLILGIPPEHADEAFLVAKSDREIMLNVQFSVLGPETIM